MNAASSTAVATLLAMSCSWELATGQDFCPTGELVYPYWSDCTNPTRYDESFSFVAVSQSRGLAPLLNESNSTYLVVLSSQLATYKLAYNSSVGSRSNVTQGQDFTIENVATNRSLASVEKNGEYLLIESDSGAATFQLLQDDTVALPCPRLYGSRCATYKLISGDGSGRGLSDFGASIMLQAADLTAFVVKHSSTKHVVAIKV
ncbi:hypothetical protein L7F22_051818 [Adiantum nelumboides]|nr:hypothetical protein [Adiantum nelumboides]